MYCRYWYWLFFLLIFTVCCILLIFNACTVFHSYLLHVLICTVRMNTYCIYWYLLFFFTNIYCMYCILLIFTACISLIFTVSTNIYRISWNSKFRFIHEHRYHTITRQFTFMFVSMVRSPHLLSHTIAFNQNVRSQHILQILEGPCVKQQGPPPEKAATWERWEGGLGCQKHCRGFVRAISFIFPNRISFRTAETLRGFPPCERGGNCCWWMGG